MSEHPNGAAHTQRELRDHASGQKAIIIRRAFEAAPELIWSALTEPDQIARWYIPMAGELRVGGYYVLEGNAAGEIRRCDRPRELALTWEYLEFRSELWLRLALENGATYLEIEHSPVPADMIANPEPNLWGLAVNWEMVLASLDRFLKGEIPEGRAVDRLGNTPPNELAALHDEAAQINAAWTEILAQDE